MRFSVASYHVPAREGTAAGIALWAICEGLIAEGHEVDVWSWGDLPPTEELPAWCRYEPLPGESQLRTRIRALIHPRSDVVRGRWQPAPGSVAVAEDPVSFAAVRAAPRSVVVVHYRTALDARAQGRIALRDVQDRRAERNAMRRAKLTFAYSQRVAGQADAVVVPIAVPVPETAVPVVEEPVAAAFGDWAWAPNRAALDRLLAEWPSVRERVRGARLLLAGRNLPVIGEIAGVDAIGPVTHARDLWSRAAVLAFPCPDTSGPKMKVLQALAHGVPVVTTTAGAEGIWPAAAAGTVVTADHDFTDHLARVLADPARRADLAAAGRAGVLATHAPGPAARSRLAAIADRFQLDLVDPDPKPAG